jgi:[ribosomal protein S5]-alanine N-acetyltransferase
MIILRKFCASDTDRLVSLANDETVSRYLMYTFPHPYLMSDAQWWISTGSTLNGSVARVIEHRGEFVGAIGINPQQGWRSHVGEIGYWLGANYWGKGFATAALRLMTAHGFDCMQLKKLCAPVLAPNTASMRVLAKCGYELEGILKSEVQKQGTYFDLHRFARCPDLH